MPDEGEVGFKPGVPVPLLLIGTTMIVFVAIWLLVVARALRLA